MSDKLTTKQAAEILNLTQRRVQVLIKSGHLLATIGPHDVYLLDRDEIERFGALERGPGKKLPKR